MLLIYFRFSGFSPYSRPGFPCLLSGSVYLAICQFPFILPCFAPTAVPQVLAWRFPFRFFTLAFRPSFLLSFVRFFSGFDYSAFRFFFSLCFFSLTVGPKLSSFHNLFRLFPYFRFCFGTQPLLRFLSPLLFHLTAASHSNSSFFLSASGCFPLAFALGSGYSVGTTP